MRELKMNRENIQLTARVIASDTEALYEVARARGVQMPHPALGIFKSVLCEIEKPNANGIRLGTKATDAAVSTLVGTQINRNHLRTDNVLGHTIDAVINKDKEVEITCIFFKDIYTEEWDNAQELFKNNKLTMSFELSADVESQDKLSDGTKRLNDYYFTGAGLLFGVKPACKKARVFEIATKKLQEKLSMERQSLIFANNQNSQKSILEVLNLMADEVKKIEEVKAEETIIVETPKVEEVAKVETPIETPKTEEAKIEDEYAEAEREIEDAAKWTTKFINSLPNSSFAAVEPAYKEGKTDNKNARHLPFKDASGKIDLPHYRNALARANQIKAVTDSISDEELRKEAMAELEKHRSVLKAEDEIAQKLCPECQQPMENDTCATCNKQKAAEVKVAEIVVEVPVTETPVAEVPVVVEPVVEAKVEEVIAQPIVEAPKDVVVVTETTQKVTDTMSQNSEVIKVETTEVRTVNDQEQQKTVTTQEVTYTYAQMEEVKTGYEKQISELKEKLDSKDKEVETLKASQVVKEEVKVEAKAEEPVVLSTGHKAIDASTEDSSSPIAKILKNKRSYRK